MPGEDDALGDAYSPSGDTPSMRGALASDSMMRSHATKVYDGSGAAYNSSSHTLDERCHCLQSAVTRRRGAMEEEAWESQSTIKAHPGHSLDEGCHRLQAARRR